MLKKLSRKKITSGSISEVADILTEFAGKYPKFQKELDDFIWSRGSYQTPDVADDDPALIDETKKTNRETIVRRISELTSAEDSERFRTALAKYIANKKSHEGLEES